MLLVSMATTMRFTSHNPQAVALWVRSQTDVSLSQGWPRGYLVCLRPGNEAQGSTCAICTGPRGTQPQWTHKHAEKSKASPPTSLSLVHLPQSWLAQWTYTEGCSLPSIQSWIREAAVQGGIPVSQHMVPDLLHQLECPGKR